MVVNDWIMENLIWITLGITIIVLIYFIYAIVQNFRKKRSSISQLNIILLIFGLMFLIFLTYNANDIEGKDWGQIILTLALVVITALYASSAGKQADANTNMAEEMKAGRYASLRPIIDIAFGGFNPTAKELNAHFSNIGLGPALNLKFYLTHPKYKFEFKHERYTVSVKEDNAKKIDFPSENLDFKDWAGFAINCDYQSVYGEDFRSVLKFTTEQDRYLEISELNRGA